MYSKFSLIEDEEQSKFLFNQNFVLSVIQFYLTHGTHW